MTATEPTTAPADPIEVQEVDTSGVPSTADADELPIESLLPVRQVQRYEMGRTIPGTTTSLVPLRDEFAGLVQMAREIAGSELAPVALRGKPHNVFLVLLTARDLGVAMTTALATFNVIEGKITLNPKVRLAMVRQQRLGKVWPDPDNNADQATWYAERADQPGLRFKASWNIGMARGIKQTLWVKDGNQRKAVDGTLADKDNWKHYPQRMVSWRALGYLLDDAFPEVGCGLYSPDELGAVTDEQGEPITVDSVESLLDTKPRQGTREDPEPNPDQLAAIKVTIGQLSPSQRTWLLEQWKAKGRDTLPPMDQLRQRHLVMVEALVKAAGNQPSGEEQPPAQEPQEGPQEAPGAPEGGAPPQTPQVPDTGPVGALMEVAADMESEDGRRTYLSGLSHAALAGLVVRLSPDFPLSGLAGDDLVEVAVELAGQAGWWPWHERLATGIDNMAVKARTELAADLGINMGTGSWTKRCQLLLEGMIAKRVTLQ